MGDLIGLVVVVLIFGGPDELEQRMSEPENQQVQSRL